MLDIRSAINILYLILWQLASNLTSFEAKGSNKHESVSFIVNSDTILGVVIIFYQYEFKGVNLSLLY